MLLSILLEINSMLRWNWDFTQACLSTKSVLDMKLFLSIEGYYDLAPLSFVTTHFCQSQDNHKQKNKMPWQTVCLAYSLLTIEFLHWHPSDILDRGRGRRTVVRWNTQSFSNILEAGSMSKDTLRVITDENLFLGFRRLLPLRFL